MRAAAVAMGGAWLLYSIVIPVSTPAADRSDVVDRSGRNAERRGRLPVGVTGDDSLAVTRAPIPLPPFPRLEPIARFVPPIDPWIQAGLGWGDEAIGEDGQPWCTTNRPPAPACDPSGPRPFLHAGFDAMPPGDRSVRAAAPGRVAVARPADAVLVRGRSFEGGGVVIVEHDLDGDPLTLEDRLQTVYQHVDPLVAAGEIVDQGQVIARTSTFEGDHLHFGVRRAPFDPGAPEAFHGLLPPPETTACPPCFGLPAPLPAFPDRWEDPEEMFRRAFTWARLLEAGQEGAGDVLETPEGYVAAGWTTVAGPGEVSGTDMWILKLDKAGRIVSQRAYRGPDFEEIRRLAGTPDGGFVVLGLSTGYGATGYTPLVLRFGPAGDQPYWQMVYTGGIRRAHDIQAISGGGYVVVGDTEATSLSAAGTAVLKLYADGSVQWARRFQSLRPERPGLIPSTVTQTPDGGFLVAGTRSRRDDVHAFILRLDASGNTIWTRTFEGAQTWLTQVNTTEDGGFIGVGRKDLSGGGIERLWLLKIRADGSIEWEWLYGGAYWTTGARLANPRGGDHVLAGETLAYIQGKFVVDLLLLRVDADGQIVGHRTFDGRGFSEFAVGLRATRDGGFILAGSGFPSGACPECGPAATMTTFSLIKTDSDLDVPLGCARDTGISRFETTSLSVHHPLQVDPLSVTAQPVDLSSTVTMGRSHACADGDYGPPPTIHSVSVQLTPDAIQCDLTAFLEGYLCTFGVPATATLPVILQGTYDALSLEARVTDSDTTPGWNDIVEVRGDLRAGEETFAWPVRMLDDGSTTIVPEIQRYSIAGEDCYEDPISGTCTCSGAVYRTFSHDPVANDSTYVAAPFLANSHSVHQVVPLLADCVMALEGKSPLFVPPGTTLDVSLKATDHQGNISTWPAQVQVTTGVNSLGCSGDACGCCILLYPQDPQVHCAGMDGMPSPLAPDGVCLAFFGPGSSP